MSNYLYLTCLDHDPVLRSQDEVSQYTERDLEKVRGWVKNRHTILELRNDEVIDYDDYFLNHAIVFFHGHVDCRIGGRDETGQTYVMDPPTDKPARPTRDQLADWMRDQLLLDEEGLHTGFEYGYLTGEPDQHRFTMEGTINFRDLAEQLLRRIP